MSDWVGVTGAITGVAVLAWTIGVWLIDRYFEKEKELSATRQRFTDRAIAAVQVDLKELKTKLQELIEKLSTTNQNLALSAEKLSSHKERFERLVKVLKAFSEKTDQRMNEIESKLEKINTDTYILRRKDGE